MLTEEARKRRILDELALTMPQLAAMPAHDIRRYLCWLALFYAEESERDSLVADVKAAMTEDLGDDN
jgi:hypothetical protein